MQLGQAEAGQLSWSATPDIVERNKFLNSEPGKFDWPVFTRADYLWNDMQNVLHTRYYPKNRHLPPARNSDYANSKIFHLSNHRLNDKEELLH